MTRFDLKAAARDGSQYFAGKRYLPDDDVTRSDLLDYAREIEWFDTHLVRMLKMLEDENVRLKRIVADLTPDKQILQDVVRKKL